MNTSEETDTIGRQRQRTLERRRHYNCENGKYVWVSATATNQGTLRIQFIQVSIIPVNILTISICIISNHSFNTYPKKIS